MALEFDDQHLVAAGTMDEVAEALADWGDRAVVHVERAWWPEAERCGLPPNPTFVHQSGRAVWVAQAGDVAVVVAPCDGRWCATEPPALPTVPQDEAWLREVIQDARRRA